ncbi:MAG: T9SS type A sorting domain-containing protein [Bacteroidota bacterium]|nr:T9SS type A sorting domain-containing protein [Bacteroidota bacterium]
MRKLLILFALALPVGLIYGQSATFNTTGATTNWSAATTWTEVVGDDADNIPDEDDDVVILNTHTASLSATISYAKSVTINNGGTLTHNNRKLYMYGDLSNSGTFTGPANIAFFNCTASITSGSTLNFGLTTNTGILTISNSVVTVIAGTSINISNGSINVASNSTLNNNGTITVKTLKPNGGSANILNNNAGSSLVFVVNHIPSVNLTLNNNLTSTVTLNNNVSAVPNYTYGRLTLAGSGSSKTVASALNVNGILTVNSGVTMNLGNNTLNLGGDLANSGTISNISTFNLNGTANQTLTSSSALTIPTLTVPNTNTIILNSGTFNNTTSNSFSSGLTLNAAGIFNLNSLPLNLAGSLSNSGTISNLVDANFNGTTAQSISSTQSLAFDDLTCSNAGGVTFTAGNHTITNSLTVSTGNLDVGTNLVTLVSDATKTAYIANSAGTMSGSMIVQRNLPARTASYSDLSSSCTSLTIDDWDNELYMSIGAPNDVPGFPGGDGSAGGFISVTEYNTATDAYDNIYTGEVLNVGQGYSVWIADDMASFPGRTIDSRGTPNMGNVPIAAVFDAGNPSFPGWNLIGNPHAAFIDWADVVAASSNVDPEIQIYDGSGNYVNATNPEIAPGQGFWCFVTTNTTVNVPQSAKTTTTSSAFMRTAHVKNYDLKLRLSSGSNPYYHEIKVVYDNKATSKYEQGKDIPFIKSPRQVAPYMTFIDGDMKFIENNVNAEETNLVLPLQIKAPIAGNYVIELEGLLSNTEYTSAYIFNTLTNEKFEINDASAVNVYFEQGQISNDFNLVLSKKKSESLNSALEISENVSIFATSDNINIKGNLDETQEVKIEVLNIMGQLILEKTEMLTTNSTILLSTSELSSEVYVVKVTTKDNKQFTNKIIVTK